MLSCALLAASLGLAAGQVDGRRLDNANLGFRVQRTVLSNGLVVLLSPDPTASSASVNMTFRAGTLFEPAGRAGMAHLVEHIMVRGRTADTDYVAMLEARGVLFLNAFTTPELMSFELEVDPSVVPLALWVHTDRLATLAHALDANDLARHRSVVDVERVQRTVDVPFGAVDTAIYGKLFPAPHPMRASVIGRRDELAKVTLGEVRAFTDRYLVPANGVLTVTGRFDVRDVKGQIDETLGLLAAGQRAQTPRNARLKGVSKTFRMRETRARQPRVSVLWRLEGIGRRNIDALTLGAWLLSNYVDGAFGTQVRAALSPTIGASFFRLDVTLPYDKPIKAAYQEAEVFLRYLTAVDMPREYFNATRMAVDRAWLFTTDSVRGRASVLTELELRGEDATRPEAAGERLWRIDRHTVRHLAWSHLIRGPGRLVVHARPIRPRQPKLSWEQR